MLLYNQIQSLSWWQHSLSCIKASSCKIYKNAGVHRAALKDERINQQIDDDTKIRCPILQRQLYFYLHTPVVS